jgi:RHS repeat-associated protein
VKSSGGATLVSYQYDLLSRRIVENPGTSRDLYYSAGWQVLEEWVDGQAQVQYVWSPVYVDALVLRDRDADGNSGNGLEERLWVQQDANFNVTALLDGSGTVVERYVYDPYGSVTILAPNWSVRGTSGYDWVYLHQGGRLDGVSGLYHFRMREYSPALGRWLQIDPLGFGAGDNNLYRYTGNTPSNATDPRGLDSKDQWLKKAMQELATTNPKNLDDIIANNRKITAAFAKMYLQNRQLYQWAGLAAYVSAKVGEALEQLKLAIDWNLIKDIYGGRVLDLFGLLAYGNIAIFLDVYWQFLAYAEKGYEEIKANEKDIDPMMMRYWKLVEEARLALEAGKLKEYWEARDKATELISKYEQSRIIQPILDKYEQIAKKLTPLFYRGGPIPKSMFRHGEFHKFKDRWSWIVEVLLPAWIDYQKEHPKKVADFMKKVIECAK